MAKQLAAEQTELMNQEVMQKSFLSSALLHDTFVVPIGWLGHSGHDARKTYE